MANPELRARLKPKDRERHERLKQLFGYADSLAGDRMTIIKAEKLAEKHLRLRDRVKDLFEGLF